MKNLPSKPYLFALVATLGLLAFYHLGRPVWLPIKLHFTGGKTVNEVIAGFEPEMQQRVPNLDALTDGNPLMLLAFKEEEKRLEIWKKQTPPLSGWEFSHDYRFAGYSGSIGPKLKEGDLQIPEGIYRIEWLNPNSLFHLSLKVGYPNSFDQKMAKQDGRKNLGTDIFIHGSNLSIGCIPLGDDYIEEVFYIVAKNGYRNAQIIIAPLDFRKPENKAPQIEWIDWEDQLYDQIKTELDAFPLPPES